MSDGARCHYCKKYRCECPLTRNEIKDIQEALPGMEEPYAGWIRKLISTISDLRDKVSERDMKLMTYIFWR